MRFVILIFGSTAVGRILTYARYRQDNPTRLAEVLVEFWRRNERVLIGIKKVGET